jgi:hypothetical protein
MTPGKSGPKPLPTLTQVVIPTPVQPVQPVQASNALPSADRVLQRLMPVFEERIRAVVEQVLFEQRSALTASLRSEVESILGEIRATDGPQSNANEAPVAARNQLFQRREQ